MASLATGLDMLFAQTVEKFDAQNIMSKNVKLYSIPSAKRAAFLDGLVGTREAERISIA